MKVLVMTLALICLVLSNPESLFAQGNSKTGQKISPKASTEIPVGFPKYVDTGNPQQDAKIYEQAKKKWIAANPRVYERMSPASPSKSSRFPEMPGFTPTGEGQLDGKNYDKAKEKWVSENPETYKNALEKKQKN